MMKTRPWFMLILTITLLVLGACTAAPAAVTATAVPATVMPATATAEACPSPTAGAALLTNAEDGYCLLYPAAYSTTIPDYIVINPYSAPGDIPGDAWVWIDTQDAAGLTAVEAAEAEIMEAGPGFNITRTDVTVNGEEAVVVDGIPAQDSMRRVFIVHNNRLYRLSFMPWLPSGGSAAQPALEELYAMILDTLHFLP